MVEFINRCLRQRFECTDTGIVDQDIDVAPFVQHGFHGRFQFFFHGYVGMNKVGSRFISCL